MKVVGMALRALCRDDRSFRLLDGLQRNDVTEGGVVRAGQTAYRTQFGAVDFSIVDHIVSDVYRHHLAHIEFGAGLAVGRHGMQFALQAHGCLRQAWNAN